jgi:regulator of sigma E protease
MLIILIVIIGLSLLILGHEAGHFFVAKMFGLKIDEFGFGFPPRIFAVRPKGSETEYSFNWLPFGGFVKIGGERGEMALGEKLKEGAKEGKEESEKSVGVIKSQGETIGQVPAHQSAISDVRGERLFYAQPAWKKSLIVLAGVIINFIFGWILISIVLMVGTPQTLVITGIEPNSPAAAAGIQSGDVVQGYTDSQSFINYINAHKGEPTQVAVLRDNKEIDFTVTPRTNVAPDQGAVGVELEEGGTAREAPLPALWDGLISSGLLLWLTISAFGALIAQLFVHASLLPGVVGPVGIFGIAEETGKIGLMYLIQLLGIISINLTVVNCIPFPALDGGRFVMILIEKIKGSPVPEKLEAWVNGIGFAMLLVLMLLLTVRDIRGLV